MSKHTPGPWTVDRFKDKPPYLVGNLYEVVCVFDNHARMKDDHREGNAKLIAAAPDLLKALKAATVELSCLAAQVEAREGGSVIKALYQARAILDKVDK